MSVLRLARSSSTRARYRWFPVSFRIFFAKRTNRTDERVSFINTCTQITKTPAMLKRETLKNSLQGQERRYYHT